METKDLKELVAFSPDEAAKHLVLETGRIWAQLACLQRNQQLGPIADPNSDAIFTVVAGKVVLQADRKRSRLAQWEVALVPAGSAVTVTNASEDPAVVLIVTAPPPAQTSGLD
jgi:quercetin dioxygenase-like cupin family protein